MKKLLAELTSVVCAAGLLWELFAGPVVRFSLPLAKAIGWGAFLALQVAVDAAVVTTPAVILIASGVAARGRRALWSEVPVLWSLAALVLIAAGCVSGTMLARQGQEVVLQETYYVVAHFRYVMRIGALFALFAGAYFWLPRLTGYVYSAMLGNAHFWLTFIGVAIAIVPTNYLALASMPRATAEYADTFARWNAVSSVGAVIAGAGTLLFLAVLTQMFLSRRPAITTS